MKIIGRGVVAVLSCFCAAQAEDCKLISFGAIPMTQIAGETSEFVPVEINGVPKLMLLDTGASMTTISAKAAAELNLRAAPSTDVQIYDVTGNKSAEVTKASLKIGPLKGDNMTFMVGTSYLSNFPDPRVAGLLGADIFRKYDISVDFGAHTFTMLDQNHCDGQVVYWPEHPIAVVPFKLVNGTEIILTVTLDGHEIKAQLDTGASRSTLEKTRAEGKFGLTMGSPDTPSLGASGGLPQWRHRFATLSLEGLVVNNPEIDIIPDKMGEVLNGWTTGSLLDRKANEGERPLMLLGMNVLKHLHIYIAYKEKKLYITPAAAPAK